MYGFSVCNPLFWVRGLERETALESVVVPPRPQLLNGLVMYLLRRMWSLLLEVVEPFGHTR
jgi:hypothetical protein